MKNGGARHDNVCVKVATEKPEITEQNWSVRHPRGMLEKLKLETQPNEDLQILREDD